MCFTARARNRVASWPSRYTLISPAYRIASTPSTRRSATSAITRGYGKRRVPRSRDIIARRSPSSNGVQMIMDRWSRKAFVALLAAATMVLAPQAKTETVTVGLVGAVSSTHWPVYIGLAKGYYAAEDLTPDLVFIQSSAALVQQLTGGSLDLALSTGLADPIRAIDKGSPIAIVRIEMQAPPYALLAKPAIKRWPELKGKTISIGGPKDITRIYLERMAAPNGLKAGDYDTVFAGATSARFSALQSGAVDAAILLPPFNFYAESAGFTNLGLTIDYAKELPFTGTVVGRALASARNGTAPRAANRIPARLCCRRRFRALRAAALGAREPAFGRQRALSCRALADLRGDRGPCRERGTVAAHLGQRGRVRARLCDRKLIGRGDRLCHGRKRHHEARAAAVDLGPLRNADDRTRPSVHSLARHRHLVEGVGGHFSRAVSSPHQY